MNHWSQFKSTVIIRLYSFAKIPLLWWIRPSIIENDSHKTILKIPLFRKTKNHLGVMYFGALAMGAEAAIALKAIQAIQSRQQPVDFIFKDFKAHFLKRAEGDVHFICDQGAEVEALVQKAIDSKLRENKTFRSYAIVPKKDPSSIVAEFELTLSLKLRS